MATIRATRSERTIILTKDGKTININKQDNPDVFDKLDKLIQDENIKGLEMMFLTIQEAINSHAGEHFNMKGSSLRLKGTKEDMPECITNILTKMVRNNQDYMPLIRFWKKLKDNPSQSAREELYSFMLHNNIALTPGGDLIVEKGVRRHNDGRLVDAHSETIDNSVGRYVEMPRDAVDDRRNVTCSRGLHVAAPDYVHRFYSSSQNVIVECIVNPKDVVSIPSDYNDTKMRVCKYYVARIAPKSKVKKVVIPLDELLEKSVIPSLKNLPKLDVYEKNNLASGEEKEITYQVTSKAADIDDILSKMTAKEIAEYVEKQTGVSIVNLNLKNPYKNKKKIVQKAKEELEKIREGINESENIEVKQQEVEEQEINTEEQEDTSNNRIIDFNGMTGKDICRRVFEEFSVMMGGKKPARGRVIIKAAKIFRENGWTVIGA